LSSDDIEPFDWYRRFFSGMGSRRGFGGGGIVTARDLVELYEASLTLGFHY
jgi:hypothetical protein